MGVGTPREKRSSPKPQHATVSAQMATPRPKKARKTSRESANAGDRLLKAIKDRLVAQGAKVDEEILRQRGASKETIARLKKE